MVTKTVNLGRILALRVYLAGRIDHQIPPAAKLGLLIYTVAFGDRILLVVMTIATVSLGVVRPSVYIFREVASRFKTLPIV